MESIYHDEFIEILYDSIHEKLVLIWIGEQTEMSVKATGNKIFDFIDEYEPCNILNDNQHVIGSWEATIWARDYWFPKIMEKGIQRFAWVLSGDVRACRAALAAMPENENVRPFLTRFDADAWLDKQHREKRPNFRRITAHLAISREQRPPLTSTQIDIAAMELLLKEFFKEGEFTNDFREFNFGTRTERFLRVLQKVARDNNVHPHDAMQIMLTFFHAEDIKPGELARIHRLITKPSRKVK